MPWRPERVREPRADLLERAREHCDLSERDSFLPQRGDLARDPVRLLGGMPEGPADDLRRAIVRGAQLLAEVGVDVPTDDARRETRRSAGRAVVDGQVVAARARPALLEAERIVDLGAAEAVDRLVLVRDAEDVAALAGEQLQQPLLRDVRVLVLVDEDEAEGALRTSGASPRPRSSSATASRWSPP